MAISSKFWRMMALLVTLPSRGGSEGGSWGAAGAVRGGGALPCVGCRGLLTGTGGGTVGVFGDGEEDGIAAGMSSLGTTAAVGLGVASGKERGEGV